MAAPSTDDRDVTRIAVLAYDDALLLDIAGPLEVFATASRLRVAAGFAAPYAVEVVGVDEGALRTSGGVEIAPTRSLAAIAPSGGAGIDTLLIAGGPGIDAVAQRPDLIDRLRCLAPPRGLRRLGSVCTGAFALAAAGLLDGRRAVTHWAHCADLAARYPCIRVEPDPIFVRDEAICTSAGVTAGMDLALALLEEDHGRDLALQVARRLVMFHQRPGGQAQFSSHLAAQIAGHAETPINRIQRWILDHLDADLSVERLAAHAAMSPRNFARVFARAVGTTPARFVERARLDGARRQLEESAASLDTIAQACGFGSADVLRRACRRHLGVAPHEYRQRFRRAGPRHGAPALGLQEIHTNVGA